ncbi:kinase-like domain-containing protein [Rhizophagus clarus]|uniref:Kinase-like domain-containing protein n=1 Tax=Rhizophagus clarus TaxID=94130 RepID=A0A8H3R4K5_9GLOM|nr:kinase-like domain-containing protein [Rhizophagus clarus]
MVLRYIYGGRLSLEEYDTSDIIKNTLQHLIPFINFFNLTSKEYLDKVYPYKKIIPKDLRENLFRHFMDQPNNNNLEPNVTKEINPMAISSTIQKNLIIEEDFIIVDEINNFINKLLDKGIEYKLLKQKVIEYFNDHNINAKEIYNWIVTSLNNEKAFNLFINASEKNHTLAQFFVGKCYKFGYGTIKNEELAFEYYEKAADKNYTMAQLELGYSYRNGIGIKEDFKKAFYWYEKAAKNGNIIAMHNLGYCYKNGIGIGKDYNKAFELFKQSAEGGYSNGIAMVGNCYNNGIGTKVDKQKAFELYQNAANLGSEVAQNNLALIYENGNGTTKDTDKAIYWYNKSAKQGYVKAKNNLKRLQINNL